MFDSEFAFREASDWGDGYKAGYQLCLNHILCAIVLRKIYVCFP